MYQPKRHGVSEHTGFPNPAIDASLQGLDLTALLIKNASSTYLMRIEGGEWEDQGIFAGDIAIIDRACAVKDNDIVAWWHQDRFAISQAHRLPRQAVAWGVVTSIVHQYRRHL